MDSFKDKLIKATEQGLLLFIKFALVVGLSYVVINYFTTINSGAINGTQAVIYLNELQQKGYLPKIVDGSISVNPNSLGK